MTPDSDDYSVEMPLSPGDIKSWIDFARRGQLNPPGVLVLFGDQRNLDAFVAAWHLTALYLVNIQNQHRVFSVIQHIVPTGLGSRDTLQGVKTALSQLLVAEGVPPEAQEILINQINFHQLTPGEGQTIHEILHAAPENSAIAVSCANLFRFNVDRNDPVTSFTNWTGTNIRVSLREQIYLPHIIHLMRTALSAARERNILVVLFCEEYGPFAYEWPEDLQNDSDLAIVAADVDEEFRLTQKHMPEWHARAEHEDWAIISRDVDTTISNPTSRAIVKAQLLAARQQFKKAWSEIAPHVDVIQQTDEMLLLPLSRLAFDAGEVQKAQGLVTAASHVKYLSLEDLHATYLLAMNLGLDSTANELLDRISAAYPSHPTTLSLQFGQYLRARDFHTAGQLAARLGQTFDVYALRAFSDPDFNLSEFFKYAQAIGELYKAYAWAAHEAEQRGKYELARELATKVPLDSEFVDDAIRIRIRIFGRLLPNDTQSLEESMPEMKFLLYFVATHPNNVRSRLAMEDCIESALEYPTAIAILFSITWTVIQERLSMMLTVLYDQQQDSLIDIEAADGLELQFLSGFFSSAPQSGFMVGQGEVPAELKNQVSPILLRTFLHSLRFGLRASSPIDLQWLQMCLHIIILISRELKDPNTDLIALRLAIGGLVNAGQPQDARNIAEHALLFIEQPSTAVGWRIAQSWANYADAMHRSGNRLKALLFLGLCVLSWEGPALNATLLTSTIRLIARIFRDIGLTKQAFAMIRLERDWILRHGADTQVLSELEQMELSLQLKQIGDNPPVEELLGLLTKTNQLLVQNQGREPAPILILQAQLIRRLHLSQTVIPGDVLAQFSDALQQLPDPLRTTIEAYAQVSLNRAGLLDALKRVASAINWEDLAHQMQPVHMIALNAIEDAVSNNDDETFLVASTILSQPTSSLVAWETMETPQLKDRLRVREWLTEQVKATDDQTKLLDAAQIDLTVSQPHVHSLEQLATVSVSQLQSVIHADELIAVLCQDATRHLCRALITAGTILDIQRLPDTVWSYQQYEDWATTYPRSYGNWEPPTPIEAEHPSPGDVRQTLLGLTLGPIYEFPSITLVPDWGLFGFPFGLTSDGDSFLQERHCVAKAPSVTWLIESRRRPWLGKLSMTAWLGSPDTPDYSLHFLRDKLQPVFDRCGVQIINSNSPEGMNASALAVIVAHGSLGQAGLFHLATDRVRAYSAQDLAGDLNNCGCVVLFVCHAGRADQQSGTTETVGLVSELLKRGVRAVVASSWPLHVYVPPLWLAPFLDAFMNGDPVRAAVFKAAQAVRVQYKSPSAWAALSVYGDGEFLLPKSQ